MQTTAKIIGGPGTGKTTDLLRIMEKILATDVRDPTQIGFVSFTRAARAEAANRAAEKFRIDVGELQSGGGWFRTLHSCCYRILGCTKEELIVGNDKDAEWMQRATGEDVKATYDSGEDWEELFGQETDAGKSLFLWGLARNRVIPLDAAYDAIARSQELPSRIFVHRLIEKYEQAKRSDGRSDFTDLLLRVAGIRMTLRGPEHRTPEGNEPQLPVWFADEWQDCSALQSVVFRRLSASAKWVYLVGDPFQSIYKYAGSDPSIFMKWDCSPGHLRTLDKSFRCPPEIWKVGESIIKRSKDYFDRGIAPADHAGMVQFGRQEYCVSRIDPFQKWLVLARTHWMLSSICAELDRRDIPFALTSKNYSPPRWLRGVASLKRLADGEAIGAEQWKDVLDVVPSRWNGVAMLETGTKTTYGSKPKKRKSKAAAGDLFGGEAAAETVDAPPVEDRPRPRFEVCRLGDLREHGATEAFLDHMSGEEWPRFLDQKEQRGAARMLRHGVEKALNPTVRVGTIHSGKGMEEDHVLLVDGVTNKIEQGIAANGRDDECSVFYVGATRARKRLVVATHERCQPFGVPTPGATPYTGDEYFEGDQVGGPAPWDGDE